MTDDMSKWIVPLVILLGVGFGLYRRVRASLGPQRLRKRVLMVRVVLMVGLILLIAVSAVQSPNMVIGTTIPSWIVPLTGAGFGLAVGLYALRHTKFEVRPDGIYYTPHLYIGLTMLALLVLRIALRFIDNYEILQRGGLPAGSPPPGMTVILANPWTAGVLLLTISYYAALYLGILRHADRLGSEQTV